MDIDIEFWGTVLVGLTGIGWLFDRLLFEPKRKKSVELFMSTTGQNTDQKTQASTKEQLMEPPFPFWLCKSLFPVFLVVLLVRSFIIEPFTIPSSSMEPTLYPGDFVVVNKFTYGLRLPVLRTKILDLNEPQRGDVMVFRYPVDQKTNYIKRVIGVPGDTITYEQDKTLRVNGEVVEMNSLERPKRTPYVEGYAQMLQGSEETIYPHRMRIDESMGSEAYGLSLPKTWVVGEDEYFMMGDNRDHSQDSRYWGFVPERLIVGKAFAVWMQMPSWLPSFSRNGWIQ